VSWRRSPRDRTVTASGKRSHSKTGRQRTGTTRCSRSPAAPLATSSCCSERTDMFGQWIEGWSTFYSAHASLRSAVEFVHVGGLLAGGGCAVAADLATISSARENSAARATELQLLKRTHGLVVAGLVALVVSGVLLLAADLPTYLHSMVFW